MYLMSFVSHLYYGSTLFGVLRVLAFEFSPVSSTFPIVFSFVIAQPVILRFLLSSLIFHRKTLNVKLNLRNLFNTTLATALVQLNQYFEHCKEEAIFWALHKTQRI